MRRFRQFAAIVIGITLALLLALPPAVYWLGLNGIDGRPQRPAQLAPLAQQNAVWKQLRGSGVPHVSRDDPYSYVGSLLFPQLEQTSPSRRVCWRVARNYLLTHRRHEGMGWWHLSGAALSIWLSRNWTSEEILSSVAQLEESDSRRNRNISTTKTQRIRNAPMDVPAAPRNAAHRLFLQA